MLCMFVWGFLVLVYPNLILTAVEITPKPDAQTSAYNQVKQMWEELDRKNKRFLRNDAVLAPLSRDGEGWGFDVEGGEYTWGMREEQPSTLLYFYQTGFYAGKNWSKI